jgi:hypothetical protein
MNTIDKFDRQAAEEAQWNEFVAAHGDGPDAEMEAYYESIQLVEPCDKVWEPLHTNEMKPWQLACHAAWKFSQGKIVGIGRWNLEHASQPFQCHPYWIFVCVYMSMTASTAPRHWAKTSGWSFNPATGDWVS